MTPLAAGGRPPGPNVLEDGSTIVARATAPGRGALAVVRLSGPGVPAIARALLDPWPEEPRRAVHATARDADGAVLDDVIAVRYVAPQTTLLQK